MEITMTNEKDFKIARFIDLSACKKVFPDKSFLDYGTFVLRSPEYYRNIEDKKKRDKAEGSVEHKNEHGQQCQSERMCYLISCWTKLDDDVPSFDEWKIFSEDHIMALISTPEKVKNCIEKKLIPKVKSDNGYSLCWEVEHKEVKYYKKGTHQKSNEVLEGFHKDEFFSKEKEYRFVVNVRNYIDTLIFYADPMEYCDTAMINTKTVKCLEFYNAYEDGGIDTDSRSFIKNFKELVDHVAHFPCTYPRRKASELKVSGVS